MSCGEPEKKSRNYCCVVNMAIFLKSLEFGYGLHF